MHSPELLEHFKNPRNTDSLDEATYVVQCANPVCGDELRVSVRCEEDKIAQVSFRARGCASSIGCASALTELLNGASRADLARIRAAEVEAAVGGLSNESKHAAVLCEDAVKRLEAIWKTC